MNWMSQYGGMACSADFSLVSFDANHLIDVHNFSVYLLLKLSVLSLYLLDAHIAKIEAMYRLLDSRLLFKIVSSFALYLDSGEKGRIMKKKTLFLCK